MEVLPGFLAYRKKKYLSESLFSLFIFIVYSQIQDLSYIFISCNPLVSPFLWFNVFKINPLLHLKFVLAGDEHLNRLTGFMQSTCLLANISFISTFVGSPVFHGYSLIYQKLFLWYLLSSIFPLINHCSLFTCELSDGTKLLTPLVLGEKSFASIHLSFWWTFRISLEFCPITLVGFDKFIKNCENATFYSIDSSHSVLLNQGFTKSVKIHDYFPIFFLTFICESSFVLLVIVAIVLFIYIFLKCLFLYNFLILCINVKLCK